MKIVLEKRGRQREDRREEKGEGIAQTGAKNEMATSVGFNADGLYR